MEGLTRKVEEHGVRTFRGVQVTGFDLQGGAVKSVLTSHGAIHAELVVIGGGPWSGHFWKMLELPMTAKLKAPDGRIRSSTATPI